MENQREIILSTPIVEKMTEDTNSIYVVADEVSTAMILELIRQIKESAK
jgi:hypothetical protein